MVLRTTWLKNCKEFRIEQHASFFTREIPMLTYFWMNFIGFLFEKRIKYKILCFVYRLYNDLPVPIYLSVPFFRYQQLDQYYLRNSRERKWTVRITNNTYGKRCFWVSGAELWNSLPCDLVLSPSYDTFQAWLKTYLFWTLWVLKKRHLQLQCAWRTIF